MNKKIILLIIIAGIGLAIQLIISNMYPASESSLLLGIALAVLGIIIAIQIAFYSKAKKEISK